MAQSATTSSAIPLYPPGTETVKLIVVSTHARTDRQPQRVWSAALDHPVARTVIGVPMGVSGSGKTTVAALLAAALGCQFQEGDDLHPRENVEKMRSGTPLTDADRLPWLREIAEGIDG